MKQETLQRLIDDYDGEDLSSYLSQIIWSEAQVEKALRRSQRMRKEASDEYKERLQEVEKTLRAAQGMCPHVETTYQYGWWNKLGSNSNGGPYDSGYYCCDWCGKEL